MPKSCTVLICDDALDMLESLEQTVKQSLASSASGSKWSVVRIEPGDLKKHVEVVAKRRKLARHAGETSETITDGTTFDQADLLLLDDDLIGQLGFVSGEQLAYLLRCYSSCGSIVVLNHFGWRFDLTMTDPDWTASWADLHLEREDIQAPGLWCEDWIQPGEGEFRPWSWPSLLEMAKRFSTCVEHVLGAGDAATVAEMAGVHDDDHPYLQDAAELWFGKKGLAARSEEIVKHVLEHKDALGSTDQRARVVTSRLLAWLNREVLPAQNVLVDSPHLMHRYPSLLGLKQADAAAWNAALVSVMRRECTLPSHLESAQHGGPMWFSGPIWRAHALNENDSIEEVRNPFGSTGASVAFCEDASRFAEKDQAIDFVSSLEEPWMRRWVSKGEHRAYQPAGRLML